MMQPSFSPGLARSDHGGLGWVNVLVANAERVDLAPRGTELKTGGASYVILRLPVLLIAGMLRMRTIGSDEHVSAT
jgi:hypothetical protein